MRFNYLIVDLRSFKNIETTEDIDFNLLNLIFVVLNRKLNTSNFGLKIIFEGTDEENSV